MFPGFAHKNHPNTTKKRGVDDATDDRETPADVFDPLNAEFGFTLDAASAHHNRNARRVARGREPVSLLRLERIIRWVSGARNPPTKPEAPHQREMRLRRVYGRPARGMR